LTASRSRCRGWVACTTDGTRRCLRERECERAGAVLFSELPGPAAYPAATMKKEEAHGGHVGSQANATGARFTSTSTGRNCELPAGDGLHRAGGRQRLESSRRTPTTAARKSISTSIWREPLVHLMGPPTQTRHIFMHKPGGGAFASWSIHCGLRTGKLPLHRAAGENQTFDTWTLGQPTCASRIFHHREHREHRAGRRKGSDQTGPLLLPGPALRPLCSLCETANSNRSQCDAGP